MQGSLESALEVIFRSDGKKLGIEVPEIPEVIGSGRTDAGVHARGQVCNFIWPDKFPFVESRVKEALNALTPPGLIVRQIEEAPADFNARLTPHLKQYSYRILYRGEQTRAPRFTPYENLRVWCITHPLNLKGMILGARVLEGQHDFQCFRAKDCAAKTTIRTVVRSELVRVSDEELIYFIEGKGFLKQMVRIIVGTLVELGDQGPEEMLRILGAKNRELAGQTAPACGLALEWVSYSGEKLF